MLGALALTLMGVGLASCGRFERAQRAAWRDQAESQCLSSRQVASSSYVSFRSTPIEGPGTCGMQQPLRVSALSQGRVKLSSSATLACPIVPTTDRWLDGVVQKAAMARLGSQIVEIKAGSYSCRAMNNGSGTRRTSEHAYGNALDIFAFRTADGREVTIKSGWNGAPEERAFLREVFLGACDLFSTVLGPGADMFHYDHFHVDLARHGKGRQICKPRINSPEPTDLPPPQPDRGVWASARGGMPPAASGQAYAITDTARPAIAA
ncbi:MAG: extensin family protein, partial [Bosea sp. (in: a-proteobacteria)]